MKKVIFSIGLCLCVGFSAMAQVVVVEETADPAVTNKRGVALLPKAGDFALGISADPFLNYMGNFFGKTSDNDAPVFNSYGYGIYGKYFLQDNQAIRVRLGMTVGSQKFKGMVTDNAAVYADPVNNANAMGEDVRKAKLNGFGLNIGYEFRRGHGRVQGFYGGEVMLGLASTKNIYEYYNSYSTNYSPDSYNFNNNVLSSTSRVTESKGGTEFSAGLGGFVGVEYFFAPQMSIGGEFKLGLDFTTVGKGETTVESWNGTAVKSTTTENRSSTYAGDFNFGTTSSASIFLMFYF